jgi:hypothetical protein
MEAFDTSSAPMALASFSQIGSYDHTWLSPSFSFNDDVLLDTATGNFVVTTVPGLNDNNSDMLLMRLPANLGHIRVSTSGQSGGDTVNVVLAVESPIDVICVPDYDGVHACPCGNPPVPNDGSRGCNNYGPNPPGGTGGASLTATGVSTASLANDLVFHVTGMQTPCSLVVFFGGSAVTSSGVASGGGVRCVTSLITPRMYKTISTFNASAVDFPSPNAVPNLDPWTRSNSPAPGSTKYYYAAYRNGQLGIHPPCTPQTAFNLTNAGALVWHL